MSDADRRILLFGTNEIVEPMRRLRAAALVVGDANIGAIAAEDEVGPVLCLVNLSAAPADVKVDGREFKTIWRMDTDWLAVQASAKNAAFSYCGGTVRLDAHVVCRLS